MVDFDWHCQLIDVAMNRTTEPATPQDHGAIQALLAHCGLPDDHVMPDRFVVVRHEGDLIGCVGLEVTGRTAMLQSLAVASSFRGQGVGELLVEAACGRAESAGCARVVALTLDAADYFTALGFRVIPRDALDANALEFWQFKTQTCSSAQCLERPLSSIGEPRGR